MSKVSIEGRCMAFVNKHYGLGCRGGAMHSMWKHLKETGLTMAVSTH